MSPRLVAGVTLYFVALFVLAGCVTNTSAVKHCTYKDGELVEKTTTHTTTIAMLGSKEGLASGSVTLRIRGEYYRVGQNASGLDAGGDLAAIAQALGPFIKAAEAPSGVGLGGLLIKGAELWAR